MPRPFACAPCGLSGEKSSARGRDASDNVRRIVTSPVIGAVASAGIEKRSSYRRSWMRRARSSASDSGTPAPAVTADPACCGVAAAVAHHTVRAHSIVVQNMKA